MDLLRSNMEALNARLGRLGVLKGVEMFAKLPTLFWCVPVHNFPILCCLYLLTGASIHTLRKPLPLITDVVTLSKLPPGSTKVVTATIFALTKSPSILVTWWTPLIWLLVEKLRPPPTLSWTPLLLRTWYSKLYPRNLCLSVTVIASPLELSNLANYITISCRPNKCLPLLSATTSLKTGQTPPRPLLTASNSTNR